MNKIDPRKVAKGFPVPRRLMTLFSTLLPDSGTYANDRPPIVGTKGRESGLLRLRLVHQTIARRFQNTCIALRCRQPRCINGWRGYNRIDRTRAIVCHKDGEWARDADGDGIYETHTNTIEGVWTTLRNFLRPFQRA